MVLMAVPAKWMTDSVSIGYVFNTNSIVSVRPRHSNSLECIVTRIQGCIEFYCKVPAETVQADIRAAEIEQIMEATNPDMLSYFRRIRELEDKVVLLEAELVGKKAG